MTFLDRVKLPFILSDMYVVCSAGIFVRVLQHARVKYALRWEQWVVLCNSSTTMRVKNCPKNLLVVASTTVDRILTVVPTFGHTLSFAGCARAVAYTFGSSPRFTGFDPKITGRFLNMVL